ncbi:hypothetical protein A2837_01485 [Candidatus Kaiserbacteria bacterium RIFCSPHIGHO2_01_FULL_46_22]|uniref:Ribulose-phosphate 3-epimerase n=1 Tax=Candidatus Kaiserbacteria bacterium RIFCSPHIGHO2_01_FULL_46_22 TaxID=1798475 RepID=A0A1F6BZC9_9BACT|nr:MAG: hypothetical protein A2837_01485 [Candidatus Kaiserbacteria bacterium RIFCSPHIGHO2_01_FULL_46_22]
MIVPAIIPKSLDDLKTKLTLLSFAPSVQIDVVDGEFVENISWPYEPKGAVTEAVPFLSNRQIEVDLMVKDQQKAAKEWQTAGAKRIVFHIEGLLDDTTSSSMLTKKNDSVLFGLAINNDTPIEKLDQFADQIDFVQMMGIATIGKQGEPFDERVLSRIAAVHSKYPNLPIGVDGAVSQTNLLSLKTAGATRFVAGSSILNADDPQAAYEQLLKITAD